MIASDNFDKLISQLNVRLTSVERDVKVIKNAVSSKSMEEKLGSAIEMIETKLDQFATRFMYSQKEPEYNYTQVRRMAHYTQYIAVV